MNDSDTALAVTSDAATSVPHRNACTRVPSDTASASLVAATGSDSISGLGAGAGGTTVGRMRPVVGPAGVAITISGPTGAFNPEAHECQLGTRADPDFIFVAIQLKPQSSLRVRL